MYRVVICFFPLLMLWGSVFKLINWDSYVDSVGTFTLLPETGKALAVLIIPALEATPFALLLMRKYIVANLVVIATILFFTGVVAFHWINNVEPTCSCLGEWASFDEIEAKTPFLIARNIVLIVLASAGLAWYIFKQKRLANAL